MKKLPFGLFYLSFVCFFLFTYCEKDKISEEPTGFKFPDLDHVEAAVYGELQKTCAAHWDLPKMTDSTLVVISYNEGYEIYCNGQSEDKDYVFVITTDAQGQWISDRKETTTAERKTYFNPANINRLKLANIKDFWEEGLRIDTSDFLSTYYQRSDPGFQGGLEIHNDNHYSIWISVFQTKIDAVRAMENRRNSVAGIFYRGSMQIIPEHWWYGYSFPSKMVVNKLNTLLEVGIYSDFESCQDTLLQTVKELTRRVEVLSE